MKTLLCVSVSLLFAGCGSSGVEAQETRFKPVASVDQVMDAIIIPASEAIFDAVVYENGTLATAPKTDDDWFQLQMHALAVAEAGNLLLMPPRARAEAEWAKYSNALTDEAVKVAKAAEAKDIERLLQAGSTLYSACTGCHRQFLMAQP